MKTDSTEVLPSDVDIELWKSLYTNPFHHKLCDLYWIQAPSVVVEKYMEEPFAFYKFILKHFKTRHIFFLYSF